MSITKLPILFILIILTISACGSENSAEEAKQIDTPAVTPSPSKEPMINTQSSDDELQEIVLTGYLAGADLKVGKREFAKCRACHTVEQGQRNKMGPNLFGMFGNKVGFNTEFRYSKVLQDSDIVWDMQNLDRWLENPREFLPETSMAFVGIRNEEKRRALMAYLYTKTNEEKHENSDNDDDEE
ncbi:MAG: c-type cytochrome [Robiginitomaculum sp.]|nr:c-type cytochrome [Robiginitomaculum sp.]